MAKLLFVLAFVAVLYVLLRPAIRSKKTTRDASRRQAQSERIVVCVQCNLHIPVSEAIEEGGRYYCSDEHRRLST